VVLDLLAECVSQPREAPIVHPHIEVLALCIRRVGVFAFRLAPPTRNQVKGASGSFGRRWPRSLDASDVKSEARSENVITGHASNGAATQGLHVPIGGGDVPAC
jgi:hypothetical protein